MQFKTETILLYVFGAVLLFFMLKGFCREITD